MNIRSISPNKWIDLDKITSIEKDIVGIGAKFDAWVFHGSRHSYTPVTETELKVLLRFIENVETVDGLHGDM